MTILFASAPPAELQLQQMRITEARGPNVVQIQRAVLRRGGEVAWTDLLGLVSEPCRLRFQKPLSLYEWVDTASFTELSLAYMRWAQRDDSSKAGRAAAKEELMTLHRWMLRMMTPNFLINSLPRLFAHYHRGGIVTVNELGAGHAHMTLWSQGMYPEWYHPGLTTWLQTALELTGAEGVLVDYETPGAEGIEACRHNYRLAWKA